MKYFYNYVYILLACIFLASLMFGANEQRDIISWRFHSINAALYDLTNHSYRGDLSSQRFKIAVILHIF